MARKRAPKSSKNTLIVLIAAIVTLGMILSTLIIYIDYIRKPDYQSSQGDQIDFRQQLQAEQKNLEQEAEQLEEYIKEYDPSLAVLERLASIYSVLAGYTGWLEETAAGRGYLEKAAGIYSSLVEMEPQQVKYQFSLYTIYAELELKEEAKQQADITKQLLEQKQAGGNLENLERFYYALILDKADGNGQEALNHLDIILDTEPGESSLYSQAKDYREQLELEDKISDEPAPDSSSAGN